MGTHRIGALAAGLLAVILVGGCATPAPTPTTPPQTPSALTPTPAPTATVAPSATASPSAAAAEPTVVCPPDETSPWFITDANGSPVPIVVTLSCENAVAAAKAVVGPDPTVTYIEFAYGPWCPPGVFCALSLPNTGHVVFHRKGLLPDLLVGVRADKAGKVTATDATPLPSPAS